MHQLCESLLNFGFDFIDCVVQKVNRCERVVGRAVISLELKSIGDPEGYLYQ